MSLFSLLNLPRDPRPRQNADGGCGGVYAHRIGFAGATSHLMQCRLEAPGLQGWMSVSRCRCPAGRINCPGLGNSDIVCEPLTLPAVQHLANQGDDATVIDGPANDGPVFVAAGMRNTEYGIHGPRSFIDQ